MSQSESLTQRLEAIAYVFQKKADVPTWVQSLATKNVETSDAAAALSSEEWLQLGIPLRILVELRRMSVHLSKSEYSCKLTCEFVFGFNMK